MAPDPLQVRHNLRCTACILNAEVVAMKVFPRALAGTVVLVVALAVFPGSTVVAQQPERKGCLAVAKAEYDSAKRKKRLRSKFGNYLRTGPFWRRNYWYCP